MKKFSGIARFWDRVDKSGDCWLWTGPPVQGYGQVFDPLRNGPVRAHRMAYRLTKGELADGMHIHHVCGVKLCVRPEHLVALTAVEHGHLHNGVAEHGTERRAGTCKCSECRAAANEARRARRVRNGVKTHNASGYCNGCRCDICTEAIRVRRRERRALGKAS